MALFLHPVGESDIHLPDYADAQGHLVENWALGGDKREYVNSPGAGNEAEHPRDN